MNTLLLPTSPDVVRARSYVLLTRQGAADPSQGSAAATGTELVATGVYEDEIHRTSGGWKFKSRRTDSALPVDPAFLAERADR